MRNHRSNFSRNLLAVLIAILLLSVTATQTSAADTPASRSSENNALASTVFVDDDWASLTAGEDPDGESGPIQAIGVDAAASIQQGIDLVDAGGTVNVFPGDYTETATGRLLFNNTGPYQFGLFIGADKPGITVQGVDAGGAVISAYANVAANVTTNASNDFGPSGVFVEGDAVTISGLRFLPNLLGDNKTIEVIGDDFTLNASVIDITGGGSVYFGDWQFDEDADTSHIQSYAILNNQFAQGASLDITSGAGYTGPTSGRLIQGNRFEYTVAAYWPAISFSGACVVPWFTYPVNGAIISGNTFIGTTQQIRARGEYDNTTFDWSGYRANNTFEKTVVTLVGDTNELRTYESATTYGAITNVRRIGATIQPEISEVAQAGDTVVVSAGTFEEQVTIKNMTGITLRGAGAALTTVRSPAVLTALWGDRKAVIGVELSENITVTDLTVDGAGLGNANNRMFGVLYHNASGLVNHLTVKDIRHEPLNGVQGGVGIYAYNEDTTPRVITASNNTLSNYQKGGIVMNGVGLTAHVTGNSVIGIGATSLIAMNGIQFGFGATGTITGNVVSGHAYSGEGWSAAGILLYAASGVELRDNLVADNQIGISVTGDASGNSDDVAIISNDITGNEWGISSESSASGNANLTVAFNRIVDNTTAGFDNNSLTALAENNWWGCNAGPNQTGCDAVVGDVDTDPWLVLTLDADQTQMMPGETINLVALLSENSAGVDTTAMGAVRDGNAIAFDATYGALLPASASLVDSTASAALSVPTPVSVTSATVSATVDHQTVTVTLNGWYTIILPVVMR